MPRIDDGHATTVDFNLGPSGTTVWWEKTVTPPGYDGGGENDTTTMRNSVYRTKWPKKLITLTPMSFVASYDSQIYPRVLTMLNENQLITVTFPDDSTLAFWGWINTFTPNEVVEGEQPTANVEVIPSNQNNSKVETGPVRQAA